MDEVLCPNCDSDNCEAMEIKEDEAIVYMLCNECGHEFEEEA